MSATPRTSLRLGVLLSGGGRSLQNLLDRTTARTLDAAVACVVSDRPAAFGLERARRAELPTLCAHDAAAIWEFLRSHQVDLVCLAGYLRLLPIAPDFECRVLNIHPALLPRHGGPGFYGDRVHRAVLDAGDAESGCTVHYCDARYDTGPILLQHRVPVLVNDTVESLAARVFEAECQAYPQAIELWEQRRQEHAKDTSNGGSGDPS